MKLTIVIQMFLFTTTLFSQKNLETITVKFQQADSLQIISHINLSSVDVTSGLEIIQPIEKKGIPNNEIIKEQITLSEKDKTELIDLFQFHKNTGAVENIKCFEPHHSILIFNNGKCDYIDICFHCKKIEISKSLAVTDRFLNTDNDWKKLEAFFRRKNIKYEMP